MTLPYTPGYNAREKASITVMDRMRQCAKKLRIEDIDWAKDAEVSLALLQDVFRQPASLTVGVGMALSATLGCEFTTFMTGVKYEVKPSI